MEERSPVCVRGRSARARNGQGLRVLAEPGKGNADRALMRAWQAMWHGGIVHAEGTDGSGAVIERGRLVAAWSEAGASSAPWEWA